MRPRLAVCVKGIFYPDPSAVSRLVEWLELQFILGVEKIFVHYISLSPEALAMLKHYEQRGLVVLKEVVWAGPYLRYYTVIALWCGHDICWLFCSVKYVVWTSMCNKYRRNKQIQRKLQSYKGTVAGGRRGLEKGLKGDLDFCSRKGEKLCSKKVKKEKPQKRLLRIFQNKRGVRTVRQEWRIRLSGGGLLPLNPMPTCCDYRTYIWMWLFDVRISLLVFF